MVEKIRYQIPVGAHTFEVDEFLGANQGLILAEVELRQEDEPFLDTYRRVGIDPFKERVYAKAD